MEKSKTRRQLLIFMIVSFVTPYLLTFLMAYGYAHGLDLFAFPMAQMHYPAAGVILAFYLTRKKDALAPNGFFCVF